MLLKRILTAVVGIPIIFTCIYFGGLLFFILMFAVSFFCVLEYLTILKKYNPHKILSLIMGALFFAFLCYGQYGDKVAISALCMLLILFALEVFKGKVNMCLTRISVSFLGAFFLPLSLAYMFYLRELYYGLELIFAIFVTVWILDTAAFAAGKNFGKHKLSKNVSPKKTVEGAIAGVVFGIITFTACRYIFMSYYLTVSQAVVLGAVISVVGQFSDLAESLIKRDGKIKDSGKTIPGHGGFLDRFDSYIFIAPAVYYCLYFFK
ncbi:phosphatidate cytidylyltransferase [Endomicrobium proavitum]|uniref:Phosphatidate cytidylyltransferase n=1 Tax=Endomicrobium proavitum TaxID=1408281 RepID=A0A0G3WH43_9BACT|nr:phosphatidate cytidylyltransferase [Endomicrobium proavitum]AKL97653.1 Phosphatidate cytidylyltransferase [Endomicrobium proavitum]